MADRMAAIITIGGRISSGDLPRLLSAIADARVARDWGEAVWHPETAQELLDGLQNGRLTLCDDEASYGEFSDLESECQTLGLSFRRHSDGKYEYDAEVVDWRPGMHEPLVNHSSNGNENAVYVDADAVKKALGHLDDGHVREAIEILRELCPNMPEIPPLQIV